MIKLLGSLEKELISTFLATTHLATLCWGGTGCTIRKTGGTGISAKKRKDTLAVLCLHANTDFNVEK